MEYEGERQLYKEESSALYQLCPLLVASWFSECCFWLFSSSLLSPSGYPSNSPVAQQASIPVFPHTIVALATIIFRGNQEFSSERAGPWRLMMYVLYSNWSQALRASLTVSVLPTKVFGHSSGVFADFPAVFELVYRMLGETVDHATMLLWCNHFKISRDWVRDRET